MADVGVEDDIFKLKDLSASNVDESREATMHINVSGRSDNSRDSPDNKLENASLLRMEHEEFFSDDDSEIDFMRKLPLDL